MTRITIIAAGLAASACMVPSCLLQEGHLQAEQPAPEPAMPPLPLSLGAAGGTGNVTPGDTGPLKRFSGAQSFYFNYRLLFGDERRLVPVLARR